MKNFNLYKINRFLHRDLGYIFFGMTIIYALSGIALNHKKDWNPNFIITKKSVEITPPDSTIKLDEKFAREICTKFSEEDNFKKHYFPMSGIMRIFINNGTIDVYLETGECYLEKLTRRPIFYEFNFLHYNPGKLWTYFSDFFCFSLIIIAISGLFIIKGKNGITRRGAWLTVFGILIPIAALIFY